MDNALSSFLGWHTLVFALACWILTFFTRRIAEMARPGLKENRWWTQVILYAIPVFWGGSSASLATMYPFPEGISSFSARLFFGVVVGFFSGFMYKVVKKVVLKKVGAKEEDLPSAAPPKPPGE
jgi:prepilin signal peptidase PulO-like enzyme (type II secretory pathway)